MGVWESAYRRDVAHYRAKAEQPPEHGLTQAQWWDICHAFADSYQALVERHEKAIREDRTAEFWAEEMARLPPE